MKKAKRCVVDTNVLATANGRYRTQATIRCRLKCVEFLEELLDETVSMVIVVDKAGKIQKEYRTYCNPSGQPSVGDRFYQAVLQNYAGKVLRIDLPLTDHEEYTDFPNDARLVGFDKGDRKFAAAAKRAAAPVANAVDMRSWPKYRDILAEHGIDIIQLC